MVSEDFGTRKRRRSTHGWGISSHFPNISSIKCRMTCFSMERSGTNCFSLSLFVFTLTTIRFGRNSFQEATKLAKREEAAVDWSKFRYMVFDVPNHDGIYQERYKILGKHK